MTSFNLRQRHYTADPDLALEPVHQALLLLNLSVSQNSVPK